MTCVRPEEFEKVLTKALAEYGDVVLEKAEQTTKQVSREAVRTLKSSAPAGGNYARGWSHKSQKGGPFKLSETVYNRTNYMLTHLLEEPHETGHGGHYPKNVNYTGTIARVEDEYTNKYMQEVISKL